ncbi:MAG TPA: hypothetical protein VFN97_04710 [Actinospica sp.]|nr:hypothetical protein [Actinospica sp.]
MSGTASSFYLAEISALQTYQKEILKALDDLTTANQALTTNEVLTAIDSATGALGMGGANNGLGAFDEAVQLSNTYNSVMQQMMTNFKEISELVNAMASSLGKSAQSYQETEQQITDSFNKIVTKYETQSGGFGTTPTTSAPATTSGQSGSTAAYSSATPATSTTTTQGTTTTGTTTTTSSTSTNSGSISQQNDSNTSNDTSSEE